VSHEPAVLDTDTLSELSRGNRCVIEQALDYLADFGRLTITAVTVFERLRGYALAIREWGPEWGHTFDLASEWCRMGSHLRFGVRMGSHLRFRTNELGERGAVPFATVEISRRWEGSRAREFARSSKPDASIDGLERNR
jgi:hypothetical protein